MADRRDSEYVAFAREVSLTLQAGRVMKQRTMCSCSQRNHHL